MPSDLHVIFGAGQWDEPFVVDDRRFRERFGAQPAGLEDAARATLAWAREAYGRRNA